MCAMLCNIDQQITNAVILILNLCFGSSAVVCCLAWFLCVYVMCNVHLYSYVNRYSSPFVEEQIHTTSKERQQVSFVSVPDKSVAHIIKCELKLQVTSYMLFTNDKNK